MLYKLFNCHLFATDVDMTHLDIQKHYLYNIGQVEQLGQKFRFEYQDATAMSYDHEMFDVVCGISALEHIPGDGDTKAVKEIERVLKPGGHFIFTAPFAEIFSESETDHYHFGYEKRYDLNSIENRFHESSRLSRRELLFINGIHEQSDKVNDFWYSHKLYNTLGRISMFFSLLMYNVTKEPTNFSRGFIAHYIKT
jgi:SAM-dependent methyltransferase